MCLNETASFGGLTGRSLFFLPDRSVCVLTRGRMAWASDGKLHQQVENKPYSESQATRHCPAPKKRDGPRERLIWI